MAGISSKAAGKLENKRKYNGIELNEDLGLDAYEAHFRTLDPAIGRRWPIDPKVDAGYESISPYASMYDDPIRFSDPLGDEGSDDGIFSRAWQNFKDNVSSARDKVVGLFVQAGANLKDNIENGRTLPQQLLSDFKANPLSAITGMGVLEARVVPLVAKEVRFINIETKAANIEVKEGESTWKGPINYSEHLPDPKNVAAGKKFSPQQLKDAKKLNMELNGGQLRSDLDGSVMNPSKQSKKGVKADMNQVEGDHKNARNPKNTNLPQGTNSFDNLQLIPKKDNLKKSNN
ncbi:MAG: hypothetical protein HYU71_15880 [Bacteroidetes bacterium]|nr:hypothetical protein [Bacteroidota bacterium]